MGSPNNKPARIFSLHHHTSLPCTRAHQIGALLLIATTFFLTRHFDQSFSTCPPSSLNHDRSSPNVVHVSDGGSLSWPQRGYGSHLSLKIYVYEEDEIDGLKELLRGRNGKISADACLKGQWGTQVLSQMPYFRRSGGRDHVFVFPSGAGAHLFRSWATYINRSIILTPEADRTDKKDTSAFNTWKDIIIPGNVEDGMTKRGVAMVQPLPLSKRKYLANYLGRAQGKVGRLKLIELAKQFPDKLESPELKFSGPDKYGRIEYFQHLRDAKFCLAPRGESSWTLRSVFRLYYQIKQNFLSKM
ncbi:EXOSTOSIN FAMILY PROTEIN [Salix purpurea]|uniref:EXOSTOSIN FAMILY PROTEIN n=1 Tax=Salix purpurea TaxID=77065 RepID=A0A9Q0SQF0_SALPP|nr:EXOSTOSIN FAMILY PROTEIN [Salix purpurea]